MKATEFKIDIAADLYKWRAFVAICELGSLTRAALFLDSNQSLLSRQLNALERECGGRLFNRTGRGVEVSGFGELLFPQVRVLLTNAESRIVTVDTLIPNIRPLNAFGGFSTPDPGYRAPSRGWGRCRG